MVMRPPIVNRQKSSSHPLSPGRFYVARVVSIYETGQISVSISDTGTRYGPLFPIGASKPNPYSVGDAVMCAFTNEFFTELIVFGPTQIKSENDSLIATIALLEARIEALELNIWT